LLTVLRHAGVNPLVYDGAACPEVASPLAEAALCIEGDLDLRSLFRSVVGCDDDTVSDVLETSDRSLRSAPSAWLSPSESGPWSSSALIHPPDGRHVHYAASSSRSGPGLLDAN
jgi:hypothetical protein